MIRSGHGYGGLYWWRPYICGGLGYQKGGRAVAYCDLVWARWYIRLWEMQMPRYEEALWNREYRKTAQEMINVPPVTYSGKCPS